MNKETINKIARYLKNSSHVVLILLYIALIGGGVALVLNLIFVDLTAALQIIPFMFMTLLFIVLYYISNGLFQKHLGIVDDRYYYIAVVFAFLAMYLGSYLNFYEYIPWWDTLLHFSSGIILGFFGISLISLFFGNTIDEKADIYIILAFGVMVSMSLGVLWEFYEFIYDTVTDGNMQRTVLITDPQQIYEYISPKGYLRAPSINDTMKDLFLATTGSIIASIIMYPSFKKKCPDVFNKNKKIDPNEIEYIAIDLDGTLLNKDHEISELNKKEIAAVIAKGKKVILCSGRATRDMRQFAKELNLYENECYIVSYNGAKGFLLNKDGTEELIFETTFTPNDIKLIYNLISKRGKNYIQYTDEGYSVRDVEYFKLTMNHSSAKYSLDDNFTFDDIIKAVIVDDEQNINSMYREVEEQILNKLPELNVFTSGSRIIEVCPSSASKGNGLSKLLNHIDGSNQNLIAFGDQNNDLSMFRYAKYGVAMANATTELKKVSTHNTVTNDRNGVGVFISKNL